MEGREYLCKVEICSKFDYSFNFVCQNFLYFLTFKLFRKIILFRSVQRVRNVFPFVQEIIKITKLMLVELTMIKIKLCVFRVLGTCMIVCDVCKCLYMCTIYIMNGKNLLCNGLWAWNTNKHHRCILKYSSNCLTW